MYPKFGDSFTKKFDVIGHLIDFKASPILKSDRGQAVERKHSKLCQSFFKLFVSVVTNVGNGSFYLSGRVPAFWDPI